MKFVRVIVGLLIISSLADCFISQLRVKSNFVPLSAKTIYKHEELKKAFLVDETNSLKYNVITMMEDATALLKGKETETETELSSYELVRSLFAVFGGLDWLVSALTGGYEPVANFYSTGSHILWGYDKEFLDIYDNAQGHMIEGIMNNETVRFGAANLWKAINMGESAPVRTLNQGGELFVEIGAVRFPVKSLHEFYVLAQEVVKKAQI